MVEPITIITCAVLAGKLSFKIGTFIARIQDAGEDFQDVLLHLGQTADTISKLESILRDPTLPAPLNEEYTRELLLRENELDDIDRIAQEVLARLRHKSFFTRVRTKTLLVEGDLKRMETRLSFFNQKMTTMIATHQSQLLAVVHGDVKRIGRTMERTQRGVVLQVGNMYGLRGLEIMQDDGWGIGTGPATGEEPAPPLPPWEPQTEQIRHSRSNSSLPSYSAATGRIPPPSPRPPPPPPRIRPQYSYADFQGARRVQSQYAQQLDQEATNDEW